MKTLRWPALLVILLLGAALVVACGDDDDDDDDGRTEATATATSTAEESGDEGEEEGGSVAVTLSEWAITADPEATAGGGVTLDVSNGGTVGHNLFVVHTDLAADALPTTGGQVDGEQVDIVANSADLLAGESESLTADLEAGSYVLVCQIAGHYDLGMRVAFTVE